MFRKNLVATLVLGVICSWFIALPLAFGDNADIPPNVLSYRDRLLGWRDGCLARTAEENRCLNEDESLVREIDRVLCANPANRDAIVAFRCGRVQCINHHHSSLDHINHALSEIESELVWVEGRIKDWACLR
jgi:hypothetical protein